MGSLGPHGRLKFLSARCPPGSLSNRGSNFRPRPRPRLGPQTGVSICGCLVCQDGTSISSGFAAQFRRLSRSWNVSQPAGSSAAQCSASNELNDDRCTAVTAPVPRICLTNGRGRQLSATCKFAVHQSTQFAQIFDRTSSRSVVDGTQYIASAQSVA